MSGVLAPAPAAEVDHLFCVVTSLEKVLARAGDASNASNPILFSPDTAQHFARLSGAAAPKRAAGHRAASSLSSPEGLGLLSAAGGAAEGFCDSLRSQLFSGLPVVGAASWMRLRRSQVAKYIK